MKFTPIEDILKPCPPPRSRKDIIAAIKAKQVMANVVDDTEKQIPLIVEVAASIVEEPEPPRKKTIGPKALACGHSNWYTKAELELAVAGGFCCPAGGIDGYQPHHRFWIFEEQKTIMVPSKQRRSAEHPLGICADPVTGLYIGMKHNDCRGSGQDKSKWCEFHNPKKKAEKTETANKSA